MKGRENYALYFEENNIIEKKNRENETILNMVVGLSLQLANKTVDSLVSRQCPSP